MSLPTMGVLFSDWQGDDAGIAAGAGPEVDRETPGVARVLPRGIHGETRRRSMPQVLSEVGLLAIVLERSDPYQMAPFGFYPFDAKTGLLLGAGCETDVGVKLGAASL